MLRRREAIPDTQTHKFTGEGDMEETRKHRKTQSHETCGFICGYKLGTGLNIMAMTDIR